jgi:hypothetical protein
MSSPTSQCHCAYVKDLTYITYFLLCAVSSALQDFMWICKYLCSLEMDCAYIEMGNPIQVFVAWLCTGDHPTPEASPRVLAS